MLKLLDDLDKKNNQFSNLALLPGFNFEDLDNSSKRHNKYEESIFNLDSMKDKTVISNKTFSEFFRVIDNDSSVKKQTKKRRSGYKKNTRRA